MLNATLKKVKRGASNPKKLSFNRIFFIKIIGMKPDLHFCKLEQTITVSFYFKFRSSFIIFWRWICIYQLQCLFTKYEPTKKFDSAVERADILKILEAQTQCVVCVFFTWNCENTSSPIWLISGMELLSLVKLSDFLNAKENVKVHKYFYVKTHHPLLLWKQIFEM